MPKTAAKLFSYLENILETVRACLLWLERVFPRKCVPPRISCSSLWWNNSAGVWSRQNHKNLFTSLRTMFCKESFLGISAWSCTICKRPHKLTVCYWSNLAVMLNPLFCFLFILLMSVSNHSLDFFFLDWSCFCTIFLSVFLLLFYFIRVKINSVRHKVAKGPVFNLRVLRKLFSFIPTICAQTRSLSYFSNMKLYK